MLVFWRWIDLCSDEHNRPLPERFYSRSFPLYKSDTTELVRSSETHNAEDRLRDRLVLSNKILLAIHKILLAALQYVNTFLFPQHRIV